MSAFSEPSRAAPFGGQGPVGPLAVEEDLGGGFERRPARDLEKVGQPERIAGETASASDLPP